MSWGEELTIERLAATLMATYLRDCRAGSDQAEAPLPLKQQVVQPDLRAVAPPVCSQ
jgi:hypothetical protein